MLYTAFECTKLLSAKYLKSQFISHRQQNKVTR